MSSNSRSLNLSRERKRAFRAGKFPEEMITKDMIREMVFSVECPPGTPNYKEFKVTEGMLFTKVPRAMSPPIEYCDHLLKINDVPITSTKKMRQVIRDVQRANKTTFLEFRVRRVISIERILEDRFIPLNAAIREPHSDDSTAKPNSGYSYYKVILIYFPKSKLGINVKAYDNRVYIESTDNSWGSTTRRFLYLGDAVLKIDKTTIRDVQGCSKALIDGLQQNGIVTMIIERPTSQPSNNFVRSVLTYEKGPEPQMAMDAIQTCHELLEYYEKNGFGPEPAPILRAPKKEEAREKDPRALVTSRRETKSIPSTHFNPLSLQKVPDFSDPTKLK